jgi:hypothetical protein
MPEPPEMPEVRLGNLGQTPDAQTTAVGVTNEKSLSGLERDELGPREQAEIANIRSTMWLRVFFTVVLLIIFGWLNYQVMSLVHEVFVKVGTLDKEVMMTLIAGTVTEVAAVMYIMASFLFPKTS